MSYLALNVVPETFGPEFNYFGGLDDLGGGRWTPQREAASKAKLAVHQAMIAAATRTPELAAAYVERERVRKAAQQATIAAQAESLAKWKAAQVTMRPAVVPSPTYDPTLGKRTCPAGWEVRAYRKPRSRQLPHYSCARPPIDLRASLPQLRMPVVGPLKPFVRPTGLRPVAPQRSFVGRRAKLQSPAEKARAAAWAAAWAAKTPAEQRAWREAMQRGEAGMTPAEIAAKRARDAADRARVMAFQASLRKPGVRPVAPQLPPNSINGFGELADDIEQVRATNRKEMQSARPKQKSRLQTYLRAVSIGIIAGLVVSLLTRR